MEPELFLRKAAVIDRCLTRITHTVGRDVAILEDNFDKQDIVLLNLQRACQACIDGAQLLVRKYNLGLPVSTRDAFERLVKSQVIAQALAEDLVSMNGFRNRAVHDYQSLNLEILQSIVLNHLDDLSAFAKVLIKEAASLYE